MFYLELNSLKLQGISNVKFLFCKIIIGIANFIIVCYLKIHANCRIRRVYFSDRLYSEDELPAEFKLYLPVQNKVKVSDNSFSTFANSFEEQTYLTP